MSNKSILQTNNKNLQALINKANDLPDANVGVETYDLIVQSDGATKIVDGQVIMECYDD